MGEADCFVVYPNPDIEVLEKLKKARRGQNFGGIFPLNLGITNSVEFQFVKIAYIILVGTMAEN